MFTVARRPSSTFCDVAIAGGGVAGLSAALLLSRAGRDVMVIDSPDQRPAADCAGLAQAAHCCAPPEGIADGDRRTSVALWSGLQIVSGTVGAAEPVEGGLAVYTEEGGVVNARRLLVTTGVQYQLPDVGGFASLWGRDIVPCGFCGADRDADCHVVVSGGPAALMSALALRRSYQHVVLLCAPAQRPGTANLMRLDLAGVQLVVGDLGAVHACDGRLQRLELADGRILECSLWCYAASAVPNDAVLQALGCDFTYAGRVAVDRRAVRVTRGCGRPGMCDPAAPSIACAGDAGRAAASIARALVREETQPPQDPFNIPANLGDIFSADSERQVSQTHQDQHRRHGLW